MSRLQESGGCLPSLDVDLVSDADVETEPARPVINRIGREGEPDVARQGKQPEAPWLHPDATEKVDSLVDEIDALNIRANESYARLAGHLGEFGTEVTVSRLAEPGRGDDGTGDPHLAAPRITSGTAPAGMAMNAKSTRSGTAVTDA